MSNESEESVKEEAAVASTPAPAAEEKVEAAEPKGAEEATKEAVSAKNEEPAAAPTTRRIRTKSGKYIPTGIVHICASFNNTHVSVTDPRGAVVGWSTAGRCGFKGSRKSTAYAATTVTQEAVKQAQQHGMNEVEVRVQGPGAGRESAVRAVQAAGMGITSVKDVTPIPHNGCRPPKRRRV